MKVKQNKRQKNTDWIIVGSYIIIFLSVILLLFGVAFLAYRSFTNNPNIIRVVVTADTMPGSIKPCAYISYSQADSLIQTVRNYDNELSQKYQYLVEQKEQDSQLFYWGSLLVGLIIAIFGWFGFKSFNSIEEKAKRLAISKAQYTARATSRKYLETEGTDIIKTSAQELCNDETMKKLKGQVIEEINGIIEKRLEEYITSNDIAQLTERVGKLETDNKYKIEECVEAVFDDFLEKLKSNRHKANKTNGRKEAIE